jgi:hypothetical protein
MRGMDVTEILSSGRTRQYLPGGLLINGMEILGRCCVTGLRYRHDERV